MRRTHRGRAPAQGHSPTSIAAAEGIEESIGRLQRRVFTILREHPSGLTDEQMQSMLMMPPSTQRPRRIQLMHLGIVTDSGRTRPFRSGRPGVVWVLVSHKE